MVSFLFYRAAVSSSWMRSFFNDRYDLGLYGIYIFIDHKGNVLDLHILKISQDDDGCGLQAPNGSKPFQDPIPRISLLLQLQEALRQAVLLSGFAAASSCLCLLRSGTAREEASSVSFNFLHWIMALQALSWTTSESICFHYVHNCRPAGKNVHIGQSAFFPFAAGFFLLDQNGS